MAASHEYFPSHIRYGPFPQSKRAGMTALILTAALVASAEGSPAFVGLVTLSPDGRTLTYRQDNTIRFWDMNKGREIGSIDAGPIDSMSLAFAPDGRIVAVGEQAINLWDVGSRKLLRRLRRDKTERPYAYWNYSVAFSPDGRLLAATDSPAIRVWDAASGKQVRQFSLSDSNGVAFSPDGRLLAALGQTELGGNRIAIWQTATGKELPELTRAMNAAAKEENAQSNVYMNIN